LGNPRFVSCFALFGLLLLIEHLRYDRGFRLEMNATRSVPVFVTHPFSIVPRNLLFFLILIRLGHSLPLLFRAGRFNVSLRANNPVVPAPPLKWFLAFFDAERFCSLLQGKKSFFSGHSPRLDFQFCGIITMLFSLTFQPSELNRFCFFGAFQAAALDFVREV